MKQTNILLFIFFCSLSLKSQNREEEVRKIATELLVQYPGVSIAIGINDSIVWSEGFGYSDVTNKVKVTENTTFRYYSLSKSITGIALAKLISVGQLDVGKNANYYLPYLPEHYKNVTVAQLIGHSAGVRHYKKGEWMKISKDSCSSASDALETFIHDPLEHEAGTAFQYSTFGYTILSNIIEAITKSSFDDYVRKEINGPIGITDIGLDQSEKVKYSQSTYYEDWNLSKSKAKVAPPINNSCKMGGGGLVGTARSLAMLHLSLLNGKVLDSKAQKMYYTGLNDNNGQPLKYAFGLRVGDKDGKAYFSHSGSGLGGNSVVLIKPEQKAVIVILGNIENDAMNSIAGKMLQLFLN